MAKVNQRQLIAVSQLVNLGLASSGAVAVIANYSWESGGGGTLPTAFRTKNLDHGSNGLAQWRLGRLDNYMKFVAEKHPELDQHDFTPDGDLWPWFGRLQYQLEFTVVELKRDYLGLYAKLVKGGDVAALVADFCWQFERPSKKFAHLADRVAFGKAISAAIVKTPVVTDATTHIAALAHAEDQKQSQSAGVASVGAVGLVGAIGYHVHLPWWLWTAVVLSMIVFIVGIISLVKSHVDATNVKATAPAVTPDAPPSLGHVAGKTEPMPADPDAKMQDKVQRRRQQARLAAQGEPKTLAEALKGAKAEDAAHAEVVANLEPKG